MQLQLNGITKAFGTFRANDDIDLVANSGEVLCILGENGAGKSTLMNIVYGLVSSDSGTISIDGRPLALKGPRSAREAGIGMVHQHFMLVPAFTVAENLMLGDEPTRRGLLDLAAARRRVEELCAGLGFELDPDAVVADLPVGLQQRVEIIKALSHEARFLVFDEPTAVLTPQETDELLRAIRAMADSGIGVIFISHKLREVKKIADRILVLRRGKVVATAEASASTDELAELMVGRPVRLDVEKTPPRIRPGALDIRSLVVVDATGRRVVDNLTLSVEAGEVVGIAGVQGNGQSELVEAILGLAPAASGAIALDGVQLTGQSVREVLARGVAVVPEDRQTQGIVGEFTIAENLMLDRNAGAPFVRHGTIQRRELDRSAAAAIEEFDIRVPHPSTPVGRLSGGNAQKVVLARELGKDPRLLIAAEPTRGLDVGAIEFVHRRIVEARDSGIPVVVVSSELDEVLALSDRIAVMFEGRIVGVVPAATSTAEIGRMMSGGTLEAGEVAA